MHSSTNNISMTLDKSIYIALVALAMLAHMRVWADDVTDDTDLLMTFLIHRHGDRTPLSNSVAMSTDPDTVEELSLRYGYGQLTDEGRRTAYSLGQSIRARYGSLLSDRYNRSEIYIRSTDSTRAKMTVLTAMAAVYPTGDDNWSDTLPWQPTPYTTMPARYDPNLASINCPTFMSVYTSKFLETSPEITERYSDELARWSELVGVDISQMPVLAYLLYDVYASQISLGVPLTDELQELLPAIKEIAGEAMDLLLGDDDYVALQAGVLLNEFFTSANAIAAGEGTPVRIYSAHDTNVFAVMAAARITPRQGVPPYCSAFALELRRLRDSGELVVLPVYMRTPGAEPLYLQIEGCSALLCPLQEYADISADRLLDEATWREQCQYTDDLVVDDSSIA